MYKPSRVSPRPELPRWWVVGFSGHRHLHGHDEAVRAAVRQQLDMLAQRCPRLAGVCSAASGADTIFAEEMLARDGDLSVVLPFDVGRFARDFDGEPAGAWERARAVIRRARQRDVIHQLNADLAGVTEADLPTADRDRATAERDVLAYHEATARTVERADVLLAVWDGQPGTGAGGTASAVEYADRLGKPCVIYNPQTGDVRRLRLDQLPAPQPRADLDVSDLRHQVQAYAQAIDDEATRHAAGARRTTKRYIFLHLAASFFGAATLTFGLFEQWPIVPAAAELVVLVAATVLMNRRGAHYRGWLPQRVRAEVCRTFLATWDVRRHPTLVHQPRPPIPDQPDLFHQLRVLRQADRTPACDSLETVRDTYVKERIDGQIDHYRRKRAEAARSYGAQQAILTWAARGSVLASVVVFGLVILTADRHPLPTHAFEFLDAVLPLAVAAANVFIISQESSRRTLKYQTMVDELTRVRPAVAAAPTWDALERAVTEVEELMLQELVEWHSFVENTEHVH